MRNFEKRKYISRDASFFQNHKALKKFKVDGLSYETQSSIDWHEVKIILDATVVQKYLNNKKPAIPINNGEENLIPDIRQAKERISNIFSEKSNVMVKVEFPEDFGDDDLAPEDNLIFADGSVKQEVCTSVQEADTWYNETFDDGLNTESVQDANLAVQAVEPALKNEPDGFYEELSIGQEFKHEELFTGSHEVSAERNTRSLRKKKKCLDCDDCSHGIVKRPRIASHLNNERTSKVSEKDSSICTRKLIKPRNSSRLNNKQSPKIAVKNSKNCSNKRKRLKQQTKISSETRTPEPRVKFSQWQERKKIVHYCDHCDYKAIQKRDLSNHLRRKHSFLFPHDLVPCSRCEENFASMEELERHKSVCSFLLICKFCSISMPSKISMVRHIKSVHPDKVPHKFYVKAVSACQDPTDPTRDVTKTLELMGFGQQFTNVRKYYMDMLIELIKLYCAKCDAIYDKNPGRIVVLCHNCKHRLVYRCQKCKMTRTRYIGVWKHLVSKNTECSIWRNAPSVEEDKPSDTADQATSSNQERHDCEICDFEGTTRAQLYEHALIAHFGVGVFSNCFSTCSKCGDRFNVSNMRLKRHEEFCGMLIRLPCRFCPVTCACPKGLSAHLSSQHLDELDGRDIDEWVKEALTFRKMVRGVNKARFKKKLNTAEREAIDSSDYYHTGIQSMLKSICLECKTKAPQLLENCIECYASLNFVCLLCDEIFFEYPAAWKHATRICGNRSFTLTASEKLTGPRRFSKDKSKLLDCDHCSFKNVSKTILSRHIELKHTPVKNITSYFTCSRCNDSFDEIKDLNYHLLYCRVRFVYTCEFCSRSSMNYQAIQNHILKKHAYFVRCEEAVEAIMQRVQKKRRASSNIRTDRRFTESTQKAQEKFLEYVKLTIFRCLKCKETVLSKQILHKNHTKKCPNCPGHLKMQCKLCNKDFLTWTSIASHLKTKACEKLKEQCSLVPVRFDHTYALKQTPISNSTTSSYDRGQSIRYHL